MYADHVRNWEVKGNDAEDVFLSDEGVGNEEAKIWIH
jgi:hypothetical protein